MTEGLLRDVIAKILRERPELVREAMASASTATLRQLWETWAPQIDGNYHAPETAKTAARMLAVKVPHDGDRVALGDLPLTAVSRNTVDAYRAARRKMLSGRTGPDGKPAHISDGTVDREINTLQAMLTWHVEEGRISKNPIARWKRAPVRRRQTLLTLEQFQEFVSHGPPIFQDIATVAFNCFGLRRGEILRLEKSELNHERRELVLRGERIKTDEDRIVPVDADTWRIIEVRAAESRGPFVFVNPRDPKRSKPLSIRTFHNWMVRCRTESKMVGVHGEAIVFHLARAGGINDALAAGVNPAHVSNAAGVSLETLEEHYLRWYPAQRAAVQAQIDQHRAGPKQAPPVARPRRKAAR